MNLEYLYNRRTVAHFEVLQARKVAAARAPRLARPVISSSPFTTALLQCEVKSEPPFTLCR
jgi:hypothetical protein